MQQCACREPTDCGLDYAEEAAKVVKEHDLCLL